MYMYMYIYLYVCIHTCIQIHLCIYTIIHTLEYVDASPSRLDKREVASMVRCFFVKFLTTSV